MDYLPTYIAFFAFGVFFGAWLPASKFTILAIIVTAAYGASLAMMPTPHGATISAALIAFVCIQVGYVVGLGLLTAFKDAQRRTENRIRIEPLDTSKKTIE